MLIRSSHWVVAGAVALAGNPTAHASGPDYEFTESYEACTLDTGHWTLTDNPLRPRVIEPSGGNPGGYLYGEVSSPIPTWATASTRYEPGVDDADRRDSEFVGDYAARAINHVSADLEVIQAGSWTPGRTVTLQLRQWDATTDSVALEATYSLPDIPEVPQGWQHYDFEVDAGSAKIPPGWVLTRGDGTPGTNSDWATLMHQVDLVAFGFWKPGFEYPSLGLWKLGIDNIHVGTAH
jgi:hypothetical protein